MGFDLVIAASPIFFILPAIVQIRKNTTIAIILHAVFGAFGFLALALGMVHSMDAEFLSMGNTAANKAFAHRWRKKEASLVKCKVMRNQ